MAKAGRMARLIELHNLNEEFGKMTKRFFGKWQEKTEGNIIPQDLAQLNFEWQRILLVKGLLEKDARQLGVGVGNN